MPSPLVQSVAKRQGKSVPEIEDKWNQAKKKAEEEGHKEDWPYVVAIFKNMTGQKDGTSSKRKS